MGIKKNLNIVFNNPEIRQELEMYCLWLASTYNQTLSGDHRIKYNDLYPLLFHTLSPEKQKELYQSFTTSLGINPIQKINKKGIKLVTF